jgi:hypothetical protein
MVVRWPLLATCQRGRTCSIKYPLVASYTGLGRTMNMMKTTAMDVQPFHNQQRRANDKLSY